jgi:uncharacterized membrane protein
MNPLSSITGAIITGIVLMVIIALFLPGGFDLGSLNRWLHIISGVMWIGLLYYFNVVQIPALGAANADKGGPGGAGITKYVAPRALVWFRWAAVVTALTGVLIIETIYRRDVSAGLMQVLTFRDGFVTIGIGSWLGLIMLFNVWVLIWPNQKKVLGLKPATDAEKGKARTVATLASRINFALSIPMLMCMGGQNHGLPF